MEKVLLRSSGEQMHVAKLHTSLLLILKQRGSLTPTLSEAKFWIRRLTIFLLGPYSI